MAHVRSTITIILHLLLATNIDVRLVMLLLLSQVLCQTPGVDTYMDVNIKDTIV